MSGINQDDLVDGRYRIQSRLGTGGMADVFLAQDQQLERQVALKLLHRRFAEDPGFVERFRREAQSAANLQHPNVVSVYDRGSWDGTYYIAMEYLQGRTLKQVIRTEAPLDPVRAIDITVQILKATRFAHRRGVIHRDLKPHNVMLDDQDHAKVTDFGIARAGASDMTETGSIMGTAQYLSPEQAQGLAVGEGSDLYSIAIVLYELLTGHVPFDAESAVTIALKHVSEAPTPPTQYNPEIPPALEQTVLWALNKNPADRPQDADQFINVLEGIRESLVSGGSGQVTASMAALGAGAAGVGAAEALGAAGPHPRVQLGQQPLAPYGPSPAPAPGESGALPTVPPGDGAFGGGERPRRSRWSRIWPWLLGLIVLLAIAAAVVIFVVVKQSEKHTVPYLIGDTQSQATTTLGNAGFEPQVIQANSTQPTGDVIAQSPMSGKKTSQKTVYITVSEGQGQTQVPSVVQLTRAQAIAQLQKAGIVVSRVLTEPSSTVSQGEATRTSPGAAADVQKGSSVVLYISSGAAPVSVPDVVGDTVSVAQSALSSDFKVTVTQQASTTATAGTVISQSPTGNTTARPGSAVTLVVAKAEPTVTVPNVVGDSEGSALTALTGAGLQYKRTYELTDNASQNRTVLAQSPSGNTTSPQSTTVTVVIGKYSSSATTSGTTTTPASSGTSSTPSTGNSGAAAPSTSTTS